MNPIGLEGGPLIESDYDNLARRWITRELAESAYLSRVTNDLGRKIVCREDFKRDYAGVAIPYFLPDDPQVREYRLRRDHPDVELDSIRGRREKNKYLSPPGARVMIYFPPRASTDLLSNHEVTLIVTEGEFKTLALWRLAWETTEDSVDLPPFLPVGIAGVNNWRCHERREAPNGGMEPVSVPLPDFDRLNFQNRKVLILFDRNVTTNTNVRFERRRFTQYLQDRGAVVSWFDWPESTPESVNGIDDYLAQKGSAPALKQLYKCLDRTLERKVWRMELVLNDKGNPINNALNLVTALRHAPEWQGTIAYNEFSEEIEVLKTLPIGLEPGARYQDIHDTAVSIWMQRYGLNVSSSLAAEAIRLVAHDNTFHPVRDYLKSLEWDRTPRLDSWLKTYFGACNAPDLYLAAIGAKWVISAVARIFEPGCQADYAMIVEGDQGVGKSTALRKLVPNPKWFTDELADLGSKDSSIQLNGIWLIEMSELDAIGRADVSRIKQFLTRTIDRYRPPYGRHVLRRARQCVFAGTVNHSAYLRDETGNRRFWPFRAERVKPFDVERDRNQLWAEAYVRYQQGELWRLDNRVTAIAVEEQNQRIDDDAWENDIEDYLHKNLFDWTTIALLANGALTVRLAELDQRSANRIARILRKLGWTRRQVRVHADKREWRYFRPGEEHLSPDL